jgi:predicted ATPase/tetratricopeptide (TPR) repeat protein
VTATTTLVGRTSEGAFVAQRLAERRLVTLVGPGGIGKTSLARSVAERAAAHFPDGLRVVDLTVVDDADAVRESIAAQLGYSSFGALLDSPGDRPLLLVVDNCEHVVDAVADTIHQVLDSCRMPTVLATSRMALGVPGEAIVPIGPLELPPPGALTGAAVELFIERARDAGCHLEPSLEIAELCRGLDGVPLAIELAAARTRSMSPAELLERLGEGLDVLHRPRLRSAPRHRSLRAAIDWSFQLLDPDQQRIFTDLSVFSGPFSAPAAHAVVGEAHADLSATQDRLQDLVDASMLVAETSGATTRYRMLDTVRTLGRELLDRSGRRHLVEARFVDHVVSVAVDVIERGATTWADDALHDLLVAFGSIEVAVRWCLANDGEPDRVLLLTAVLWGLVHQAHTEAIGQLANVVVQRWRGSEHPMFADAVATAVTCQYMLGDHHGAIELASAHLADAERSPFAPATLRRAIAQAHRATGDTDAALRWFADAAGEARRLGLVSMATEAESARAQVFADLGRTDEALAAIDAARDEAQASHSGVGVAWATTIKGSILLRVDPAVAEKVLADALEECRSLSYDAGVGVCLRSLALAALLQDDVHTATTWVSELLDDMLARGTTYELRMVLDVAAPTLASAGLTDLARDLAATALSLPVVSITASVGHELFPLDATAGSALASRDAIRLLRNALAAPSDIDATTEERARGVFRSLGDTWEVGLGDHAVTVKAAKGLVDLATLLAVPGREVHCLDLAGAGVQQPDTGEVLDATARRAYEERVRDLQDELADAEADNDPVRAGRARHEMDSIVDELTRALGLADTVRTPGSTVERARSTVTQRVRASIRRIEALHPQLGRHLASSVRTGTYCCYDPELPVDWQLGS